MQLRKLLQRVLSRHLREVIIGGKQASLMGKEQSHDLINPQELSRRLVERFMSLTLITIRFAR
jgi:hypothetical protein